MSGQWAPLLGFCFGGERLHAGCRTQDAVTSTACWVWGGPFRSLCCVLLMWCACLRVAVQAALSLLLQLQGRGAGHVGGHVAHGLRHGRNVR